MEKLENCPICQGETTEAGIGDPVHYVCLECKREWVHEDEGWTTVPMQVDGDLSQLKEGANYSDIVKPKEDLGIFHPNVINLSSPEGRMLNAAMAILTTEYEPQIEFMVTYKKVVEVAKKITGDKPVISEFEKNLEHLINKHSMENKSDTPDFILAEFLRKILDNYGDTVRARDKWFGVDMWSKDKLRYVSKSESPDNYNQQDMGNSFVTEK